MAQKLLSISLGTTSAKLSEVEKAGKKVHVYSAIDIPISEGLCEDGVVLEADSLAAELKQYMSKYKIRNKKIVFSIASKRIASKEVILPFVKEKQLKTVVEMNATDYFPVGNIEDYAINYSIVEIIKNAENMQYRLNVIATPKDILEGYEQLAEAMKCQIEFIDFAGNAILQVLKSQIPSGEVSAILQIGYENTVINIMNGDIQIMQRNVATGLNTLIAAVADSVGLDEEDAKAFIEDNDIMRISSAYPDVKYILETLISSISRIFDFYNGRSGDHPITSIKFIGDATFVNGITDALSNGLGNEAEEIHVLNNVQVKNKSITREHVTNFMANIGAVIAPMELKYVNRGLGEDDSNSEKLPWRLVIISFIGAVALLGSSFALKYMSDGEVRALESQISALEPMRGLEGELSETVEMSEAIAGFYESTKGPNDSIPNLIRDLEKIMPEGTNIDSLSIENGNVAIAAGGLGKKSVAKLITELKAIDYINDVYVDYVSEDAGKFDSFTLTFKISAPIEETADAEEQGGE